MDCVIERVELFWFCEEGMDCVIERVESVDFGIISILRFSIGDNSTITIFVRTTCTDASNKTRQDQYNHTILFTLRLTRHRCYKSKHSIKDVHPIQHPLCMCVFEP